MKAPTVNWKLFPPKAHYMLYFGGVAAFWPYITVYGKQLGFSELNVGYIFTVAPIAGIISMPLFGMIADRFKIKKKLFLVFNILNLLALLCFPLLSLTESRTSRPVHIECGEGASHIKHCHASNTSHILEWSSDSAKERILQEYSSKSCLTSCQIECQASVDELVNFCDALLTHTITGDYDLPSFCTKNDSTTAATIPLSFMAQLDFATTMPLEDCIFFQLDSIAERKQDEGFAYRPLSCLPMQKITNCQINCPHFYSANQAMEITDNNMSPAFWLYALFTLLAWIAMAVVTSVADALCFQTLGSRPDLYGAQRKWGSIGWGLFTLISAFLVDVISGDSIIKNYAPSFWIATILLTLNFVVCWRWEVEEEERPKALGRRMAALIAEPKIAAFVIACVVVGMCTGLLWNFLFWYIEDLANDRMCITTGTKNWIKLLQGLISIVQCFLGELPFFYFAGKFINKFGHVNSMAIVLGTFGVRFLLYSILENPWWVLPIELFQGLTYGIFYTNMATYAYVVSPEGTAATVQGIVGSAFEGVGVSFGSLIGGFMYQYMSGRTTFRAFGVFALLMGFLFKVVMMGIDRKFEPISQNPDKEFDIGTEMKPMSKRPK
ncbi:Major facilitator superfamily domain-containing protein 6 [Orchesella cincta]|uniref:Major facilitator superfamily domain-containing protein 6 n=1 Tax=Orchesella cincta TaxID=48709 RepID=A0A1D2M2A0_ORCCI|nr:Major facilitator superfamily domain-containing protein 6 [Orchesella cincta]